MDVNMSFSVRDTLFSARAGKYEEVFKRKLRLLFDSGSNIYIKKYGREVVGYDSLLETTQNFNNKAMAIVFGRYHHDSFSKGNEENLKKLQIGAEDYDLILPILDNIDCSEKLFVKDGLPLASYDYTKNILYLFFNTSYNGVARTRKVLNLILEILDYFRKIYHENGIFKIIEENTNEESINKNYNTKIEGSVLKAMYSSEINDLEYDINNCKSCINDYLESLNKRNKQLEQRTRELNSLMNTKFNDINITNKYVKDIIVDNSYLHVFTDNIFITDFNRELYNSLIESEMDDKYKGRKELIDGKKYKFYIGLFEIIINLNNFRIEFKNINNPRYSYWHEGCQHPHISYDGTGCFGDLTEMIAFASSEHNFALLIDFCIQYLQSANLEDVAGRYLVSWDILEEDENGKLTYYETGKDFNFNNPVELEDLYIKER